MAALASNAVQIGGPRRPLLLRRNGMPKTEATLKEDVEVFDMVAEYGGYAVVIGVGLEVILAFVYRGNKPFFEAWGPVIANGLVAFGVVTEIWCSRRSRTAQAELDRLSKEEVALANERASNADLARADLEAKLLPRELNQDQWDCIQSPRGKFETVSIAFETDVETRWFAGEIRDAFFAAGISVAVYPRAPDVHSFGTLIFDPKGFNGGDPKTAGPLVEIFRKADLIGSLAVITEIPADIMLSIENTRPEMRAPLDAPMIIVGGRFVIPPPHIDKAAKAAKAAQAEMAKLVKAGIVAPRESSI